MSSETPRRAEGEDVPSVSRLLVLGANGPTGREVVRRALDLGYEVCALTRHPGTFPIRHDSLEVVSGDATDPAVIDSLVSKSQAVICTIGAKFTWREVEVYSTSAALVAKAMTRYKHRRLVVVTSAGVSPSQSRRGALQKGSHMLMRYTLARTVYDDMARMEALITTSGLDWTIVRPPGLTNTTREGYVTRETEIEGAFCTRQDLADMLVHQITDTSYLRKVAAVTTPGLSVSALQMFQEEVLKR